MKLLEISGQWWIFRQEADGALTRVDGPYQDPSHAAAMGRLYEL